MDEHPIVHRSIGLSGAKFYDSVCGLVDTDHYTTFADTEVTCPDCKKSMPKNRREKQREKSLAENFTQSSGMHK